MGLPSKAASASNIFLKDKNEIVFASSKAISFLFFKKCPFSKASLSILRKTWYLN